jgi:hypothetical protein
MTDKVAGKPVFDFRRVTRKWSKAWRRVSAELVQIGVLLENPARADLTPEEVRTLTMAKAEALGRLDEIEAERETLLCEVLVSVPREWLAEDAPEALDWRQAESLDWLLDTKFQPLIEAMAEARNSPN